MLCLQSVEPIKRMSDEEIQAMAASDHRASPVSSLNKRPRDKRPRLKPPSSEDSNYQDCVGKPENIHALDNPNLADEILTRSNQQRRVSLEGYITDTSPTREAMDCDTDQQTELKPTLSKQLLKVNELSKKYQVSKIQTESIEKIVQDVATQEVSNETPIKPLKAAENQGPQVISKNHRSETSQKDQKNTSPKVMKDTPTETSNGVHKTILKEVPKEMPKQVFKKAIKVTPKHEPNEPLKETSAVPKVPQKLPQKEPIQRVLNISKAPRPTPTEEQKEATVEHHQHLGAAGNAHPASNIEYLGEYDAQEHGDSYDNSKDDDDNDSDDDEFTYDDEIWDDRDEEYVENSAKYDDHIENDDDYDASTIPEMLPVESNASFIIPDDIPTEEILSDEALVILQPETENFNHAGKARICNSVLGNVIMDVDTLRDVSLEATEVSEAKSVSEECVAAEDCASAQHHMEIAGFRGSLDSLLSVHDIIQQENKHVTCSNINQEHRFFSSDHIEQSPEYNDVKSQQTNHDNKKGKHLQNDPSVKQRYKSLNDQSKKMHRTDALKAQKPLSCNTIKHEHAPKSAPTTLEESMRHKVIKKLLKNVTIPWQTSSDNTVVGCSFNNHKSGLEEQKEQLALRVKQVEDILEQLLLEKEDLASKCSSSDLEMIISEAQIKNLESKIAFLSSSTSASMYFNNMQPKEPETVQSDHMENVASVSEKPHDTDSFSQQLTETERQVTEQKDQVESLSSDIANLHEELNNCDGSEASWREDRDRELIKLKTRVAELEKNILAASKLETRYAESLKRLEQQQYESQLLKIGHVAMKRSNEELMEKIKLTQKDSKKKIRNLSEDLADVEMNNAMLKDSLEDAYEARDEAEAQCYAMEQQDRQKSQTLSSIQDLCDTAITQLKQYSSMDSEEDIQIVPSGPSGTTDSFLSHATTSSMPSTIKTELSYSEPSSGSSSKTDSSSGSSRRASLLNTAIQSIMSLQQVIAQAVTDSNRHLEMHQEPITEEQPMEDARFNGAGILTPMGKIDETSDADRALYLQHVNDALQSLDVLLKMKFEVCLTFISDLNKNYKKSSTGKGNVLICLRKCLIGCLMKMYLRNCTWKKLVRHVTKSVKSRPKQRKFVHA